MLTPSWTKSSGVTGEPFGDNGIVAVSEKNVLRAGGIVRWGVRNVVGRGAGAGWSIPPDDGSVTGVSLPFLSAGYGAEPRRARDEGEDSGKIMTDTGMPHL